MKIPWYLWAVGGAGVLLLIIISSFFVGGACRDFKATTLLVNGQRWSVAVAQSDAEKAHGLAGCKSIPTQSGMYFPFSSPTYTAFWMKGMAIPIDIIWIADGRVVGVEPQVPPLGKLQDDPPQYKPPRSVTGVLEVGAGEALREGIKVGSTITTESSS